MAMYSGGGGRSKHFEFIRHQSLNKLQTGMEGTGPAVDSTAHIS